MIAVRLEADGHRFDLEYTEGARLGDISIDGKLVDCKQVGSWDWQSGKQRVEVNATVLSADLAEWIADSGADYIRELPYL